MQRAAEEASTPYCKVRAESGMRTQRLQKHPGKGALGAAPAQLRRPQRFEGPTHQAARFAGAADNLGRNREHEFDQRAMRIGMRVEEMLQRLGRLQLSKFQSPGQ